jgi:flagellar biosynthesis protein FlhA
MGLIDQNRHASGAALSRQRNFYGAMDRASRFVKETRSPIIIILHIKVAAIGIAQHGMSWREALQTYTLLTVGDGIVTQIPALVIATGTGIIVTRAATDAHLAQEVAKQIFAHPRAVLLVMLALLALAFLPGMPLFAILGLASVAVTIWRRRRPGRRGRGKDQSRRGGRRIRRTSMDAGRRTRGPWSAEPDSAGRHRQLLHGG